MRNICFSAQSTENEPRGIGTRAIKLATKHANLFPDLHNAHANASLHAKVQRILVPKLATKLGFQTPVVTEDPQSYPLKLLSQAVEYATYLELQFPRPFDFDFEAWHETLHASLNSDNEVKRRSVLQKKWLYEENLKVIRSAALFPKTPTEQRQSATRAKQYLAIALVESGMDHGAACEALEKVVNLVGMRRRGSRVAALKMARGALRDSALMKLRVKLVKKSGGRKGI